MTSKRNTHDARRTTKKVWRIFHFEKRFEMDAYRRRGGLDYVRMFVTATTADKSNESTDFMQQLSELEYHYPDHWDAYEGLFWRLCRLTATLEDWLRGYLLDAEHQPLSEAKLAARLHRPVAVMRRALAALRRVGLIEQVELPEFAPPKAAAKAAPKKTKSETVTRRTSKKAAKSGRKRGEFQNVSERSETFQNVLENSKSLKNNRKENGIVTKEKNNPDYKAQSKVQALEAPKPTARSPAAAPEPDPANPTESDASRGLTVRRFTRGPSGSARRHAGPVPIGDLVENRRHWLDPEAVAFGEAIFGELGLEFDPDSVKGRSEVGCFAKQFLELAGDLPPPVRAGIKARALRHAAQVRRAKRPCNRSAVWVTKFQGLASTYRRAMKKGT